MQQFTQKVNNESDNRRYGQIIVSNGGLAIAGAFMKSLKIGAELNKVKVSSEEPEISNSDVFRSYLGLLLTGRTNYEDIQLLLMLVLVFTNRRETK